MPTAFWKPSGAPETAWTRVVSPTLPGLVTALEAGVPTMFVSADDAVTILAREVGIEIIPLARQVSRGLQSFTVDFSVTNPLPGGVTATYEAITIPTPGATLEGSQLTMFFDDAFEGLYVVRRTRSDGVIDEFRFNLTVVQPVISVVDEIATINFGNDDPDATTYTLTADDPGPEGGPEGPLDGVAIPVTREVLNSLLGADPPRVAFTRAPVIARATGSGPLAVGDVAETVSDATWAQLDAALVTVTPQWVITDASDNHTVIPDETGPSVIRPATPGLILRRRLLDSTGMIWSNPLDLAALAALTPAQRIHTFGDGNANSGLTSLPSSLNISSALIGDWVYFGHINNSGVEPGTVTFAGNAVGSPFASDLTNTDGRRTWWYRFQLLANGTGSTLLEVSNFGGNNSAVNAARTIGFIVRGGGHSGTPLHTLVPTAVNATTVSGTITPAVANSLLIASRIGAGDLGTPVAWTNATRIGETFFTQMAFAEVLDPALSARTVTAVSPTGRNGHLMLIAIPPA